MPIIAGDLGHIAEHNRLSGVPLGTLGSGVVTTDSNGGSITSASGVVDITGMAATVTVGASRRIKISVDINYALSTTGGSVSLYIREGSTTLHRSRATVAANDERHAMVFVNLTPSTGAHTYKFSMATSAGTLRQLGDGTGEMKSTLLVEDIGV